MLKIKAIFVLQVSILLLTTIVNAAPPKQVAIFVNGYTDCCADEMWNLKGDFEFRNFEIIDTPWISLSVISGATSERDSASARVTDIAIGGYTKKRGYNRYRWFGKICRPNEYVLIELT